MNVLIKKEYLEKLNFELIDKRERARIYKNDVFNVTLTDDPERPIISIDEVLNGGNIVFPGAYTLKDLRDLMFFHYGEDEYTKRFGSIQI